jgi:hypothetical protein
LQYHRKVKKGYPSKESQLFQLWSVCRWYSPVSNIGQILVT